MVGIVRVVGGWGRRRSSISSRSDQSCANRGIVVLALEVLGPLGALGVPVVVGVGVEGVVGGRSWSSRSRGTTKRFRNMGILGALGGGPAPAPRTGAHGPW